MIDGIPYGQDAARPTVYDPDLTLPTTDVPEPPDFEGFWARTVAEADGLRLDVRRRAVTTPWRNVVVDDLTFAGYQGTRVHAWLIRLADVTDPLPLTVEFCGYGGGRGLPVEHLAWASAGFAHLVVDSRGQGSATEDTRRIGAPGPDGFHVSRGIVHPDTYYYRRLIVDAVRAVDAGLAQPEVSQDTGATIAGVSQGGGLALAVAALRPDISLVLCDLPFLCGWPRAVRLADRGPYADLNQVLATNHDLAANAFATLAYFDGVSFAARATARASFSVALRDRVCPPSTVLAAYTAYGGPKSLATYPHNDHEGGGHTQFMRQLELATSLTMSQP